MGVSSIKLNYRGEPSLHPRIVSFVREAADRLHLPFPLLSDAKLALTQALRLPTMEGAGLTLIKRLALVIDDATITKVFYPVFPPDRNAADVHAWLREHRLP